MKWIDYSDEENKEIKKDNEEYGHIECFCPKYEEEPKNIIKRINKRIQSLLKKEIIQEIEKESLCQLKI